MGWYIGCFFYNRVILIMVIGYILICFITIFFAIDLFLGFSLSKFAYNNKKFVELWCILGFFSARLTILGAVIYYLGMGGV
jgi:hypothetical protein